MEDIEALKINEEIRKLKATYCRLADSRDWETLASLFVQEGTMTFYDPSGELIAEVVGRQNIVKRLSGSVRKAIPIHHVFSAEIEIQSATRASAIWSMEDYVFWPPEDRDGQRTMHGFGHYHETYELKDGRWLVGTMKLTRLKLDFQ